MLQNSDWKKRASVATGVIGVISSILSLLTANFNTNSLITGLCLLVASTLIIIAIIYIIPKNNLPSGLEFIANEMDNNISKQTMRIVFPCDKDYYREANKLAKEKFGKNSVSTRTVNDWQKKNRYILSCLTDNNKMVGYFDILPLKTDFAKRLINGEVGENDIRAEHILSIDQIKKVKYIYFAGIAVQNTDSGYGCIHGTYLIFAAILYVKLFYSNSSLEKILTIPTSECGLKIAQHLNFSLEREGRLRKDGFDIFSKDFEVNEIKALIKRKQRLYKRFDANAYSMAYETILA